MPNISMRAVDTISSKLGQADAIAVLLICDCDSKTPINDKLRAFALDAISDLISDSKALFRAETERKEATNER